MESVWGSTSGSSSRAEAYMPHHNKGDNSHRGVRDSFRKLQSWREDSQKEFTAISNNIDKGINDLIEEVRDVYSQLAVTTKERNDLVQTVGNLSAEIRKLTARLEIIQALPNIVDTFSLDNIKEESMEMEVTDTDKHSSITQLVTSSRNDKVDTIEEESLGKEFTDKQDVERSKNSSECGSEDALGVSASSEESSSQFELTNKSKSNQKSKDKKFKCGQWPLASAHSGHLKDHIKEVHDNIGKHISGECGYATSNKWDLRKHIEGVHQNFKNNVCEESGYATSDKSPSKKNIEAAKKKIKNHVCGVWTFCPKPQCITATY